MNRVIRHLNVSTFVTRQELCLLTGLSDRQVRLEIEKARKRGIVIYADSEGKGYKLASTPFEVNSTKRLYESRIESEIQTYQAMFGYERTVKMLRKQLEIAKERVK